MELKLLSTVFIYQGRTLLIVPYGIETCYKGRNRQILYSLLIVPYGIETYFEWRSIFRRFSLLIVPYGIETN